MYSFVDEYMPERPQDLSRFRDDAYPSTIPSETPAMSRPQIIVSPRKLEVSEINTQEQVR